MLSSNLRWLLGTISDKTKELHTCIAAKLLHGIALSRNCVTLVLCENLKCCCSILTEASFLFLAEERNLGKLVTLVFAGKVYVNKVFTPLSFEGSALGIGAD